MTNSGYHNSFRAMRLNVKEEELKERRLRELQVQEDKKLGIWAKKQLRIEQQITTKQSPLQRARRIRMKRQEEINRIHMHSSIDNRVTDYKTCEKRVSKRLNSFLRDRELERNVENELVLPEEDITRTNSTTSLPVVSPTKKYPSLTNSRSRSLPTLLCYTTSPQKNKRPSLPAIDSHKTYHGTQQHKKLLPPIKNCWT